MIHCLHLATAIAYFLVGPVLFACGCSAVFRFSILRNEAEREATFKLVAIFIWACFLDHLADSVQSSDATLLLTALLEAVVSVATAAFLVVRVWKRRGLWRK